MYSMGDALDGIIIYITFNFNYHLFIFNQVVSNDGMYGHDKKFIAEVHKIISTVVEEILKYLHGLSSSEVSMVILKVNL